MSPIGRRLPPDCHLAATTTVITDVVTRSQVPAAFLGMSVHACLVAVDQGQPQLCIEHAASSSPYFPLSFVSELVPPKLPPIGIDGCRTPPSAMECRRVPSSAAECRRVPPSATERVPSPPSPASPSQVRLSLLLFAFCLLVGGYAVGGDAEIAALEQASATTVPSDGPCCHWLPHQSTLFVNWLLATLPCRHLMASASGVQRLSDCHR